MRALTELKKVCFDKVGYVVCQSCDEDKSKFLLIHHKRYFDDSVIYSQFEDSDYGRLKYYSNLLDEIKKRPDNFNILCFECHKELEKLLKMEFADADSITYNNNLNSILHENYEYNHTLEREIENFFWS